MTTFLNIANFVAGQIVFAVITGVVIVGLPHLLSWLFNKD